MDVFLLLPGALTPSTPSSCPGAPIPAASPRRLLTRPDLAWPHGVHVDEPSGSRFGGSPRPAIAAPTRLAACPVTPHAPALRRDRRGSAIVGAMSRTGVPIDHTLRA